MGILNSIFSTLGLGKDKKDQSASTASPASVAVSPAPQSAPPSQTTVAGVSTIDVVARLESLASAHSEKLNWRVSIVDLMKLLGLDSSLAARKELAGELGCPAEKMGDSAQMNIWLHKALLKKLSENGGNIPADLLD